MEHLAREAIEAALEVGADFADVRVEDSHLTTIEISNGVTKKSATSRNRGAGIRAFKNGAWAFGQENRMTANTMRERGKSVAELALAIEERASEKFELDGPTYQDRCIMKVTKDIRETPIAEKVDLARRIDKQAHDYDERIVNSRAVYGDFNCVLHVANSFGTSVTFGNSLPRVISSVTAKENGDRRTAFKSYGGRGGFEELENEYPQTIGTKTAELAVEMLRSTAVQGGVYDVILDPILNGVMIHEAFGHACEADNWPAHTTVLEGKLGDRVGPENLNIVDDPTLPGMRGSFDYDWEGTKATRRSLVKDGFLTELLHSLETASRLDKTPNGAARAQSFMYSPMPRMSNTFMESGDWNVDEMVEDTDTGLLLCSFNYGYTSPAKGQFMFQASHGFEITNGEIGDMVRDVSIAGQILDILPKIDAIGDDFRMDSGTCGKSGQKVPDMSGGPHARIRKVPVGGM
ncbi:MAG: TldD/PmbA family protein [Candidatus Thorarchaeota archaeon]